MKERKELELIHTMLKKMESQIEDLKETVQGGIEQNASDHKKQNKQLDKL